jgi:hypothetical protein
MWSAETARLAGRRDGERIARLLIVFGFRHPGISHIVISRIGAALVELAAESYGGNAAEHECFMTACVTAFGQRARAFAANASQTRGTKQ